MMLLVADGMFIDSSFFLSTFLSAEHFPYIVAASQSNKHVFGTMIMKEVWSANSSR
jgi:hypothetical protein